MELFNKNSGIVYLVNLRSKFHEVKPFNWGGNVPYCPAERGVRKGRKRSYEGMWEVLK